MRSADRSANIAEPDNNCCGSAAAKRPNNVGVRATPLRKRNPVITRKVPGAVPMPTRNRPLADTAALVATVVICTRNRAQSLAQTLSSVAEAAKEVADPFEVLIVDNGSTDDTHKTVESFAHHLPIRRVVEDEAGLSNARNCAIENARGQYFVWTDDDVLVDRRWLAEYIDAFKAHPQAAVFGGRAIPRLEQPASSWFSARQNDLASLLALRNEPEWDAITPQRVPFGLNYAVRADVQRQHRYDPNLGVAPGRRTGGEETAMIRAALESGATGVWVWNAVVHHLIPHRRQSSGYIFQYYRAFGYSFPDVKPGTAKARMPVGAFVMVYRLARKGGMAAIRRILGREDWVASFVSFARAVGTVDRLSRRS